MVSQSQIWGAREEALTGLEGQMEVVGNIYSDGNNNNICLSKIDKPQLKPLKWYT